MSKSTVLILLYNNFLVKQKLCQNQITILVSYNKYVFVSTIFLILIFYQNNVLIKHSIQRMSTTEHNIIIIL